MPAVRVGTVVIHYDVKGDARAPALLMLNSLGTNMGMWEDQMSELRQRFRVIRYDVRGHGQSSSSSAGEYPISTLATDALAVLDAADAPSAHWCGLSLGGMTAMWVAAHRPERVLRLVLCNTSAYMPPASAWQSRIDLVLRDGMTAVADAVIERSFTAAFRAAAPDGVKRIRSMLLASQPEGYAAACGAIRDMDQRADLRLISAPTLVVCGSKDPATPVEHSEVLKVGIAGSHLVMLDAAHLSNIERSNEFSKAICRFLI